MKLGIWARWRGHLFQRVREDLDHVRAVTERQVI